MDSTRPGPWPQNEFPPRRLSYGTWTELGEEIHLSFFVHRPVTPAPRLTLVRDSLEYALELYRSPKSFTEGAYGMGPDAYHNWLNAIDEHGASHGNWWNAAVWAECRKYAGEYLGEIAGWYPSASASASALADELSGRYSAISGMLYQVADQTRPVGDKTLILEELEALELEANQALDGLLQALPQTE